MLSDPDEDPAVIDEFEESQITNVDDVVRIFSEQFYFGCEADDPMNALAFDRELNPHGTRLNAIFASDIGNWDVPDMREVLPEAWELVEDGHLDEADFREFTFGNAARMLTSANPASSRARCSKRRASDRAESVENCGAGFDRRVR
jgi:hypothetical protein